jgi:hypothetical protein
MPNLLHRRMNEAYAEMERNLRTSLYAGGDVAPLPKKSFGERVTEWKWRVHSAWLILRGKLRLG